jgi:predicted kinase
MTKPIVYLLCGLTGSGKSTYAKKLHDEQGLRVFSIDDEYFKAVGNEQQEHRDYALEMQIEERIRHEFLDMVKRGESLVLDYGFWKKAKRDTYRQMIETAGGEAKLVYFSVPKEELLRRLAPRNNRADNNTQLVTPAMLDDFVEMFEVPEGEGEAIIYS